ncbi:MAG: hypothetical protein Q9170_002359 [Blastenia crenularia]
MFSPLLWLPLLSLTLAADTDPSDQQSDSTFCNTYTDCSQAGLKYWNTLQTTLADPLPIDRTDSFLEFPLAYRIRPSDFPFGYTDLEPDLAAHGFSAKALSAWEVASVSAQTGEADDPAAFDNTFDVINGLIIAQWNYNDHDTRKTLPWSEIIYQTWQHVQSLTATPSGGGSIKNLQAVIRDRVSNTGTLNLLTTLFRTRGVEPNKGDATWYSWTEAEQHYFFFALLGTDNVKGVVWLLNDHAVEIGGKEITRIWVRWPGVFPTIWIEIQQAPGHSTAS